MKKFWRSKSLNWKKKAPHHQPLLDVSPTNKQWEGIVSPQRHPGRKSPWLWKERVVDTNKQFNKIFASTWVDSTSVVFGTKDNKVCMYDTTVDSMYTVNRPVRDGASTASVQCGVHSIVCNYDSSLLAMGGERPEDIAVMDSTNLAPKCILAGHSDWVYGIDFVGPHTIVSGGRDGLICLWKVDPESSSDIYNAPIVKPYQLTQGSMKLRALAADPHFDEDITTLTTTGEVCTWDVNRLTVTNSKHINGANETVCLAPNPLRNCVAVGGKSNIHFVDAREKDGVKSVASLDRGWGVRSVSWQEDLLTIGGGAGRISFYDIRRGDYLEDTTPNRTPGTHNRFIQTHRGWVRQDINYLTMVGGGSNKLPSCIYTHAYDPTNGRLFVGGGPTAFDMYGSLAAVFM